MAEGTEELQRHPGRPRAGRSDQAGTDFDPAAFAETAAAAAAAAPAPRSPRPRVPIPYADWVALKAQAAGPQAPAMRKAASTLVQDRGRREFELAAVAAAPAAGFAPPALAPAPVGSFAGIPATGWIPFDATLAAGPEHVLLSVNSSVAFHAKTGGAAVLQRRLSTWFANVIPAGANIFDPKALFDQHAGRWVLLAVARASGPDRSWFALSVSKSSDPLGGWWNYALDASKDGATATANWADYPALGVDAQALYVTANMFRFVDDAFQYAKIRVIPKAGPYGGGAVAYRDFVRLTNADGSLAFTLQPCHTFGAPQVEYLVNSVYPRLTTSTQNRLSLWSLTNPLATPALVRRTITTDPYGLPPDAVQRGGGTPLDTGDARLLNAVFRGGSVWSALTTRHDWGDGVNVAATHWFQIDATTGALVQQGVFGARRRHYFYPAVAPDGNGNMTMAFCRSGREEFAALSFTGRTAADPLGQLQASALLKVGTANYLNLDGANRNRWGDYLGIAVDPIDGRTVWLYGGVPVGATAWATWVGGSRF